MLRYINKIKTSLKVKKDKEREKDIQKALEGENIFPDLAKNLELLKAILGESTDVIIKEFQFGFDRNVKGATFCIDGLVNMDLISASILKPFMYDASYKIKIDKEKTLDLDEISASSYPPAKSKRSGL